MATVTLNIPDAALPRIVEALCFTNNLPMSPANAKEAVRLMVTRVVNDYEARQAQMAALAAVTPPTDPGIT